MRYQFENTIKDRLMYCLEWKQNIDVYLANKKFQKKQMKNTINQNHCLN